MSKTPDQQTFGRRFATYILALIVLFFAIGGYVQSARNGNQLDKAASDRSKLVANVGELLQRNHDQSVLIDNLRTAIIAQNKILRRAGLKTTNIPGLFVKSQQSSNNPPPNPPSTVNPTPTPNFTPTPKKTPSEKPTERPTHHPGTNPPRSTPNPVKTLSSTLCSVTHICIRNPTYKEPVCCGLRTKSFTMRLSSLLLSFFRP